MFYCVSPYYAFGGIVKDAFIHPAIDGSNPVGTGALGRLFYYNGRPLLSGIVALNLRKLL